MPRPAFCLIALIMTLIGLVGISLAGEIVTVPVDLGAAEVLITPVSRLEEAFAGDQEWPIIQNVQLRLVGSHTCQYANCAENPSYQVYPTEGAIAFGFMVEGQEVFRAEHGFACNEEGEDFDLTLSFATGQTPDWSFLSSGTGTLFVEHQPTSDDCAMFAIFVGVDAVLTNLELLVEMPAHVPAEKRPWGAIKAFYR